MKDNLKLGGDWHKPEKKQWNRDQLNDWLYMVLPSIVIACLVVAALVVGFYKFIVQ